MFGVAMVKVPIDFQDYDDDDPNIERRTARWKFWDILKQLRTEYMKDNIEFHAEDFVEWIDDKFGIKLNMNATGITDEYIVTNEQKYIVFKLKYG
jgi:hypothetical protein